LAPPTSASLEQATFRLYQRWHALNQPVAVKISAQEKLAQFPPLTVDFRGAATQAALR